MADSPVYIEIPPRPIPPGMLMTERTNGCPIHCWHCGRLHYPSRDRTGQQVRISYPLQCECGCSLSRRTTKPREKKIDQASLPVVADGDC